MLLWALTGIKHSEEKGLRTEWLLRFMCVTAKKQESHPSFSINLHVVFNHLNDYQAWNHIHRPYINAMKSERQLSQSHVVAVTHATFYRPENPTCDHCLHSIRQSA